MIKVTRPVVVAHPFPRGMSPGHRDVLPVLAGRPQSIRTRLIASSAARAAGSVAAGEP